MTFEYAFYSVVILKYVYLRIQIHICIGFLTNGMSVLGMITRVVSDLQDSVKIEC